MRRINNKEKQRGIYMKRSISWKTLQISLLLLGIAAGVVSFLFLMMLDTIVHQDLYNYGLQFSLEWANEYWTYLARAFLCIGIIVATNLVGLLILNRALPRYYPIKTHTKLKPRLSLTTIISLALFGTGITALAASIVYSSSTLAFIGLGLTFWGLLFLYMRSEDYIPKVLLDNAAFPSLATLNQIISELGFKGQAVYLSPEYLKDFETSRVFIPKQENTQFPTPKQTQKQEGIFVKKPEGILIKPPCSDLVRFFEKTLDTNLINTNLQYLERNLPRLLIEDLDIAENVEIKVEGNRVYAKIENSIYRDIYTEAGNLPNVTVSMGYPICSAIACAITKAAGKPVVIERSQKSEDNHTINVEFRLLEKQ